MHVLDEGSLVSPAGFTVGSATCGLKQSGKPDVALLVCEGGARAAGVFTTNLFAAAPVRWSRQLVPADDLRAVVVNSGNANACTGPRGEQDVVETVARTASLIDCEMEQIAVCSTGVIGEPLPMDRIHSGVEDAFNGLSAETDAARGAERAIMTTDTRPKGCAVESQIGEDTFRVGGMVKGAGMIAPHLATMLGFVTTDVQIKPELLQQAAEECTQDTFNAVTVDGDTSTNDSVLVLASGKSGVLVQEDDGLGEFKEALRYVMQELAVGMVRDGEGANILIRVDVQGAATCEDARKAARAISESLLVKCAIHGRDPNWGRIVCAAGYSGADFDPDQVTLHIGETKVFEGGMPTGHDASGELQGEEVRLLLDLGAGDQSTTMWTCDLSKGYVEINAEYHT